MFSDKHKTFQFLRFCAVGAANTTVDFGAFFLLNLGGVQYLPAQVLSYSIGVLNSFIFNRRWTFKVVGKANSAEIIKFIIVNGLSLLISSCLIFALHDVSHVNLWISKVIATGGGMLVNYIGSRLWVFTESQPVKANVVVCKVITSSLALKQPNALSRQASLRTTGEKPQAYPKGERKLG